MRKDVSVSYGFAENALIPKAISLERAGQVDEALRTYSMAIKLRQNPEEAFVGRGNLLQKQGKLSEALSHFEAALKIGPNNAKALHCRGNTLFLMGRHQEACDSLRQALQYNPDLIEARVSFGAALQCLGQTDAAIAAYNAVILAVPDHAAAISNFAALLIAKADYHAAVDLCERAVVIAPGLVSARFNLGLALQNLGQRAKAEGAYRAVVAAAPRHAAAWLNLGKLRMEQSDPHEALICFQQACQADTKLIWAHVNLAFVLREMGEEAKARELFDAVIDAAPYHASARVGRAIASIPIMPMDAQEKQKGRAEFSAHIDAIIVDATAGKLVDLADAIGCIQPYYLAYHGEKNLNLLSRHGDMCNAALQKSQPTALPALPRKDGRIAIGIVSAHFKKHSVWDAITRGLLETLDRSQFSVTLFNLTIAEDDQTKIAQSYSDRWVDGVMTRQGWANAIAGANLDMLVYPEIGMDQTTLQLASMRLVQHQAVFWGHPETTGLATIDTFLSAEALEPENADLAYREQLVQLPNLGVSYRPNILSKIKFDAATLRHHPDQVVVLCPGASFKYQPEDDYLYAEIIERGGDAVFVFFNLKQKWMSEQLRLRLQKAFKERGLCFEVHCKFIDWLNPAEFAGLIEISDLCLDSLDFSGFNTVMQAVEMGVPYLAYEGQFLRGRLASGVFRLMGLPELVAIDRADFIGRALGLINRKADRQKLAVKILEQRRVLWLDRAATQGFEDFVRIATFRN